MSVPPLLLGKMCPVLTLRQKNKLGRLSRRKGRGKSVCVRFGRNCRSRNSKENGDTPLTAKLRKTSRRNCYPTLPTCVYVTEVMQTLTKAQRDMYSASRKLLPLPQRSRIINKTYSSVFRKPMCQFNRIYHKTPTQSGLSPTSFTTTLRPGCCCPPARSSTFATPASAGHSGSCLAFDHRGSKAG